MELKEDNAMVDPNVIPLKGRWEDRYEIENLSQKIKNITSLGGEIIFIEVPEHLTRFEVKYNFYSRPVKEKMKAYIFSNMSKESIYYELENIEEEINRFKRLEDAEEKSKLNSEYFNQLKNFSDKDQTN